MPKQTFFNLPDEKRQQIIDIALDEFVEYDYAQVSISRIVARAGIAKGSFYQYFDDKDDLYTYLLSLLVEAKTEFLSLDHPDPTHIGVFSYLRWMAETGVAFELAYPKLSQLGLRAFTSNNFPPAFDVQARTTTQAFYRKLIEVGKAQGDIDPNVDVDLAAFMFDTVLSNLAGFIFSRFDRDEIIVRDDGSPLLDLPEMADIFARTVTILETGMGVPKPETQSAR
ncbi:MAG: TetR/AcrR family transcriptional regulator [Caldilineales bacterium]|nr:TetR/AcrR family transcriptional regulator [Caldilineales bacterium]